MDKYLTELWEAAKTAGPFGTLLMLIIAYAVNQERRAIQKRCDDLRDELLERTINAIHTGADTVKDLTNLFSKMRDRGGK